MGQNRGKIRLHFRGIWAIAIFLFIAGCSSGRDVARKDDIVKIVDFELSPDEEKIAFTAVTPVGNTDIWVVDIDGTDLRKLTFKDRSPSNHIARFFKKRKWRNFFEVDMHSPKWTQDNKITFCQELTKHDKWGMHTVSLRYWAIISDGTNRMLKREEDKVVRRKPFSPIREFELSDYSDKYKKKIFLKDDTLWFLDSGETNPEKLIQ